jgi:hypothetical protein
MDAPHDAGPLALRSAVACSRQLGLVGPADHDRGRRCSSPRCTATPSPMSRIPGSPSHRHLPVHGPRPRGRSSGSARCPGPAADRAPGGPGRRPTAAVDCLRPVHPPPRRTRPPGARSVVRHRSHRAGDPPASRGRGGRRPSSARGPTRPTPIGRPDADRPRTGCQPPAARGPSGSPAHRRWPSTGRSGLPVAPCQEREARAVPGRWNGSRAAGLRSVEGVPVISEAHTAVGVEAQGSRRWRW